jgi:hypothetical protein
MKVKVLKKHYMEILIFLGIEVKIVIKLKLYLLQVHLFLGVRHISISIKPFQPSDAMWRHAFHLSLICMSFAH